MDKTKVLLAATLVFGSAVANAHTVYFDASNTSTSVGSSFSLDLKGRSFFIPTDKGGVNFTFDPRVLQVEGITVNNATWEVPASAAVIDNGAGRVTGLGVASATGHGPTFDLAEIVFKAVGSGSTGLTLSEDSANRFTRAGQADATIPGFNVANGAVSVAAAPVPIPATAWLLGSALATLIVGRRRTA